MTLSKLTQKQKLLYRLDTPQLIIGDGIVRCGKSKAAIYGLLNYGQQHYNNHAFALAFRSAKQHSSIGVREVRAWARETGASVRATDGGLVVSTANGHTNTYLRVLGRDVSSVDSIQGLTLAGAFVDEAPLQPEDFIQELSFRCSVPGSRLVMVCNPAGGKRHWFYRTYIKPSIEDPTFGVYVRFTLDDEQNPALPAGYYADLRRRYPEGHVMRRKLDAEWVEASGLIWNIEGRVRQPPKHPPKAIEIAVDVASSSGTHAVLIGKWPQGFWVIDEWRHDGQDNPLGHAQQVAEIVKAFRQYGRVNKWVVDPSAADFKVQVRNAKRMGATTARVFSGNNDVLFGIQNVGFYFAQAKLMISPRCDKLLTEIDSYVWDESPAARNEDKPVKQNDHGCDALRYWVMMNEDHSKATKPIRTKEVTR